MPLVKGSGQSHMQKKKKSVGRVARAPRHPKAVKTRVKKRTTLRAKVYV